MYGDISHQTFLLEFSLASQGSSLFPEHAIQVFMCCHDKFKATWDTSLLTTHLSRLCPSFVLTLWLLEGSPPQGHKNVPYSDMCCSYSLYSPWSSASSVTLKPLQQNLSCPPNWSIDLFLPSAPSLVGIIRICGQLAPLSVTRKASGRSLRSYHHPSPILWYLTVPLSMEEEDVLLLDLLQTSVHTLFLFDVHMRLTC